MHFGVSCVGEFTKRLCRPLHRIRGWVAKQVEEEGLRKGVELGESSAAHGTQRLRPVQHLPNPLLFRQGGERHLYLLKHFPGDHALRKPLRLGPES